MLRIIFKRHKYYLEGIFVTLLMFLFFSNEIDYILPNIFNLRDYLRVEEILNGNHIFHGPELSKNGYIPGPFYYYFILFPYYLANFKGVAYFMFFCLSSCFGLLWTFLSTRGWDKSFLLIAVLFLINPIHKNLRDMVWNPSFLPIFWVSLLILLYLFYESHASKFRYWYLFSFIASLAIQIHMSSLFWLILGNAFFFFMFKSEEKKWKLWCFGIIIFLLPFVPFLVWVTWYKESETLSPLLTQKFDISAIFMFLSGDVFEKFSWMRVVKSLVLFFQPLYIIIFLTLFIFRLFINFKNKSYKALYAESFFVAGFLLTLLFTLPTLLDRDSPRYMIVAVFIGLGYIGYAIQQLHSKKLESIVFILFFFGMTFNFYVGNYFLEWSQFTQDPFWILVVLLIAATAIISRRKRYILSIVVLFLTYAFSFSRWHQQTDRFLKLVPLHIQNQIVQQVFNDTHWSPEEFNRRIMWSGVHPEFSIRYVYKDFFSKQNVDKREKKNKTIKGYLIIHQRVQRSLSKENELLIKDIKESAIKKTFIGKYQIIAYGNLHGRFSSLNFLQNSGLPSIDSRNFLKQYSSIYNVPTFNGRGPNISFIHEKEKEELIIFSAETSRIFTLGSVLWLEEGILQFLCDSKLGEIHFPNIGISVGSYESDLPRNFSSPHSYLVGTVYTPLGYHLRCKKFKPMEFKARIIKAYTWGQIKKRSNLHEDFKFIF